MTRALAFLLLLILAKALPAQSWTGSWAASQQTPEPNNALSPANFDHAVLRQIVHLSTGGKALRLHLSNAFGTQPLRLTSVSVARPVSPSNPDLLPDTSHPVLFDGNPSVIIPAGAEYLSDPIAVDTPALSDLAVTLAIDAAPAGQTGHPGSRATSYLAHQVDPAILQFPRTHPVEHWYFLSAVDVTSASPVAAIVTFGDSITDGHGSTTNGNDRWPDLLAERLQHDPATRAFGVVNAGIGGNHLLTDGLGPNALARFDRDVLAPSGVRFVLVLEGVNDLGGSTIRGDISPEAHRLLVARLLGAYTQMIERAHAHGLLVYGGTITPYTGSGYYHPGPASEADRQAINAWIRQAGHFDATIDFDRAIADPAHPDRMLPLYDSGDHLHPSPAGYRAMANAINLQLFTRPPAPANRPPDRP